MHAGYLVAAGGVLAATILASPVASGQSGKYAPPRTPDGKPDLQGTFTFRTITPLQRPAALTGKDVLTPAEAAAFAASENLRLNRDTYDPRRANRAPVIRRDRRAASSPTTISGTSAATSWSTTAARRSSSIRPDGSIPYGPRAAAADRGRPTTPETLASSTAASSASTPDRR